MIHERDIAYLVIGGSRAYGTSHDKSDLDVRGAFFPDAKSLFGMNPKAAKLSYDSFANPPLKDAVGSLIPSAYNDVPWDVAMHDVREFLRLCVSSPNNLETMFAPDDCVLHVNPAFEEIRACRSGLLSQQLRNPFLGFAEKQRLLASKTEDPVRKWKTLGHGIRVLAAGSKLITTGKYEVRCDPELAKFVLAIRAGSVPMTEIELEWGRMEVLIRDSVSPLPGSPVYLPALEAMLINMLIEHDYR